MKSTTVMDAYNLVHTHTGAAEAAITTDGFYISACPTGYDIDLLSVGAGNETSANNLSFTFASDADENDVWGLTIYGGADGGSWQPIALLSLTVGAGLASAGVRYVDIISATNYHLTSIASTSNPVDTIASIGLDMTGFRYLQFRATTTPASAKYLYTYARYF